MDYNYIKIILLYLFINFIIFIFVAKVSYKLSLIDVPNKRKSHPKPTAYTGGLALILSYIFALYLFNFPDQKFDIILSIASLVGLVGFIDDKYNLNVGGKLSLQIIPIIYLIALENFNLIQIGDYYNFKADLGSFSIPFTLLSVIFLINSFNYFDGLDGTLSFATLSTLCILMFLIYDLNYKIYLIAIIIPLTIFLFFNFSLFGLRKLFLGDSGSLLLGFIIAFTLIYFANKNIVHPILLAWSISIFVYEFISINLERLFNKKNIFRPGLDHLHHIFMKKTNSLFLTNLYMVNLNFIFFIVGYFSFKNLNPLTSLFLFLVFFFIFFVVRKKLS